MNDKKYDVSDYNLSGKQINILEFCRNGAKSRKEIFEYLKMANSTLTYGRIIFPLIVNKLLQFTEQTKIKSKNQKYFTTELGENSLHF